MLDSYVDSIQEHVKQSVEDLDSINELLLTRHWTRVEQKGAERLIQVLVEACIGIAKHWLKKEQKSLPSDAYSVFDKLLTLQVISPPEAQQWRRIIGMRNAIVHDYLNLDDQVIKAIIDSKMYLSLERFALTMSEQLRS